MTGSGACVFCPCDSETAADQLLRDVLEFVGLAGNDGRRDGPRDEQRDGPRNWKAWKARSLNEHPLTQWIEK